MLDRPSRPARPCHWRGSPFRCLTKSAVLFGKAMVRLCLATARECAMTIRTLIDQLIDREGGYVDHPADRGGATRWGITAAVARANGYQGAIRDLPQAVAADIYERVYWQAPGF